MNAAERQLLEDRETRAAARALVDARVARMKAMVAHRSPARRLGDEAMGRVRVAAKAGADVASDGRWIIAGVGVALVGWFARRPLLRGGKAVVGKMRGQAWIQEPASIARRLSGWMERKVKL
jgi:hypothetical protein